MPDAFANITELDNEMLNTIAGVLELRAANPQQKALLDAYLSEIDFPNDAEVLEVGCGTGPVCRAIAAKPNVATVVGVDPAPVLLQKAEALSRDFDNLTYREADGRGLPFDDASFDVVILHTILTHVPKPEDVLAEGHRVLRPGGWLGVCDGDFSTASLALGDNDPLQSCCDAFIENFVTDKWLVRRLQPLVAQAGFDARPLRSYGHVETLDPGLTLTWVDRGADALCNAGCINRALADALKAEGRERARNGNFFGYMKYASLVARKPA